MFYSLNDQFGALLDDSTRSTGRMVRQRQRPPYRGPSPPPPSPTVPPPTPRRRPEMATTTELPMTTLATTSFTDLSDVEIITDSPLSMTTVPIRSRAAATTSAGMASK